MRSIREEFEKAYDEKFPIRTGGILHAHPDPYKAALWAARWVLEMAENVVVVPGHPEIVKDVEKQIRTLASELEQSKEKP